MGMTIEEIIEELESTKDYPASDPASDEALDGAIDTMRKYQKIEQIMKKEYHLTGMSDCLVQRLVDIRKVIEDGNDT